MFTNKIFFSSRLVNFHLRVILCSPKTFLSEFVSLGLLAYVPGVRRRGGGGGGKKGERRASIPSAFILTFLPPFLRPATQAMGLRDLIFVFGKHEKDQ